MVVKQKMATELYLCFVKTKKSFI